MWKKFKNKKDVDSYGILRWWLGLVAVVVAAIIGQVNGFFNMVLDGDASRMSLVVFGLFIVGSIIGMITTIKVGFKEACPELTKVGWFLSNLVMTIGFAGTLIGFIIMFGEADLSNLSADAAAMSNTLGSVGKGLSTAFFSTLSGLIAAVLLQLQFVNIEFMWGRRNRGK